jgi:glycosyltransferase involved in cell wall biosynthesis
MRILYVSAIELDSDGGPKTHILEMLREWEKQGNDILLLNPYFDRKRFKVPIRVNFYPFFGYSFIRRMVSYIFMFTFLLRSISKFKPTAVYERQMEHNPFVFLACKIFKVPLFVEINGLMAEDLEQTGSARVPVMIHKAIEKDEIKACAGVLCTSTLLKQKLTAIYPGISSKICFIQNGVNLNLFRPLDKQECRQRLGFETYRKYIGYVGSFSHLHNLEQAIESFMKVAEKIPDAQLIMVGDGPKKEDCKKLTNCHNLTNRIQFTGPVDYETVPSYINCFDVALVVADRLRLEREGVVAFKLWEFLACGCPTIAQYLDQEDYEKFYSFMKMVHIDDKEGLSNGIIELLGHSDKSSKMSCNSLDYIKRKISWEKSALLSYNFINEMLKSAGDYV